MTEERVMTKCKGDDPAFPFVVPFGHVGWHSGLTKREWFAWTTMQGMLANGDWEGTWSDVASFALRAADALIDELNRKAGE
jgi:hypothetical protein